jgi:hypothetical protein
MSTSSVLNPEELEFLAPPRARGRSVLRPVVTASPLAVLPASADMSPASEARQMVERRCAVALKRWIRSRECWPRASSVLGSRPNSNNPNRIEIVATAAPTAASR